MVVFLYYLQNFYYEYLLHRVGAAPFTGFGASIKKGASDDRIDGMAYRVYSCGVYQGAGQARSELIDMIKKTDHFEGLVAMIYI